MNPKQIVRDADGQLMTLEQFLVASEVRIKVAAEITAERMREAAGDKFPAELVYNFLRERNIPVRRPVHSETFKLNTPHARYYLQVGGLSADKEVYVSSTHLWVEGACVQYKREEGYDCENGIREEGLITDTLADPTFFDRIVKWLNGPS
jgi:hypothetical protein